MATTATSNTPAQAHCPHRRRSNATSARYSAPDRSVSSRDSGTACRQCLKTTPELHREEAPGPPGDSHPRTWRACRGVLPILPRARSPHTRVRAGHRQGRAGSLYRELDYPDDHAAAQRVASDLVAALSSPLHEFGRELLDVAFCPALQLIATTRLRDHRLPFRNIPVTSTRRSASSSSALGSGTGASSGAAFSSQPVWPRIASMSVKG